MKSLILTAVLLTALGLIFSGAAFAGCGGCCSMKAQSAGAEKGGVVNSVCPVIGGEVAKDTSYTAEYKGKTIGFCCAGCVKEFKANPEKYMAKLENELAQGKGK